MNETHVSLQSIKQAAKRIHGIAHITPVLTSRYLDTQTENTLFLKAEHLQRVGAFKFRGAQNAVAQLSPAQCAAGVATQSSGNHAQALALAAALRGIASHIVMPSNAPQPKVAAVKEYGATITFCPPTVADRERVLKTVLADSGATYVPPYDHPSIISGQGTIGLELLDQVPELEVVVAPVGGGGLLAGVALAIKEQCPHISIIGAEPAGADDAARSLAAGTRLPQHTPNTIADGLLTGLGACNWPLIQKHVDSILTVEDTAIVNAMQMIWQRTKQLIEPSAAVAVAAVLSPAFRARFQQQRVAVILSGGNLDLLSLCETLNAPKSSSKSSKDKI